MMRSLPPRAFEAALRSDFYLFLVRAFQELNGRSAFLPNWHIELICQKLQACFEGRIKRLIINVPPRSLKSLAASIALPAWWLGHKPTAQIIALTYGQDLSDKLARDSRAVMTAPWYRSLFATRLAHRAVQEFATTKGGFRLATSVGGVLTGRGADLIIIDDPLKPDEAVSDSRRESVNDWFDNSLYSRLNDKRSGCIILIMQRLHED